MHTRQTTRRFMISFPLHLLISVLCIFTTSWICTGCSHSATDRIHKNPHELTIGINNDPLSLDPRTVTLIRDICIVNNTHEGLFRNSPKGIIPALVESYEQSDDHLTYTFYLKPSRWSNGDPVTAYDFEDSLRQLHTSQVITSSEHLLQVIKNSKSIRSGQLPLETLGIHAVNNQTLIIELEKPIPHFLYLLSHPIFFPTHKTCRDTYRQTTASQERISNGPFYISHYLPQTKIILTKNPYYFNAQNIHLETIALPIHPNPHTTHQLFQNRQIDWEGLPMGSAIPETILSNIPEEQLTSISILGTASLICNMTHPATKNYHLRCALLYALDIPTLLRTLHSQHTPATHFLPRSISYLPHYPDPENDPERRKRIAQHHLDLAMQEVSIQEIQSLTCIYPAESMFLHLLMQGIRQQWKQNLNLDIPAVNVEYLTFLEKRKQGDFSLCSGGWLAEFAHPLSFLTTLGDPFQQGFSYHAAQWYHHQYNQCVQALFSSPHYNTNIQGQAEQILFKEKPLLPLYHYQYTYAINRNIQGIFCSNLGIIDLRGVYILEE